MSIPDISWEYSCRPEKNKMSWHWAPGASAKTSFFFFYIYLASSIFCLFAFLCKTAKTPLGIFVSSFMIVIKVMINCFMTELSLKIRLKTGIFLSVPFCCFLFLAPAVHSEPSNHLHLEFRIFISVCGSLLQQENHTCLKEGCRRRESESLKREHCEIPHQSTDNKKTDWLDRSLICCVLTPPASAASLNKGVKSGFKRKNCLVWNSSAQIGVEKNEKVQLF